VKSGLLLSPRSLIDRREIHAAAAKRLAAQPSSEKHTPIDPQA
jgi:hypothetical protein